MRSIQGRLCSILSTIIVVIAALTPAAGALSSSDYVIMPPGDFILVHSDTGHFDVYYDSLRITDPGDAVMGAERAYTIESAFYGPYDKTIRVILAANHPQYASLLYNYLSGEDIPEANVASGWGEGERATIVIEAPDQIPDFSEKMAHELAIIAMRTSLIGHKDEVPEWFSEGLAIYVSGDLSPSAAETVAKSCQDRKAMSVSEIEGALQHTGNRNVSADEENMARAHAGMLVEYAARLYGNDTIKLIMQDFATTGDLDDAFVKRTGSTPEEINGEFKASLENQQKTAGAPDLTQQVWGFVLDTAGRPMANDTIAFTSTSNDSSLLGKTYTAMTNGSGYYKLNLTTGPYSVRLDRNGYAEYRGNITLQKAETRTYNVTLVKEVVPQQNYLSFLPSVSGDQTVYVVLGLVNIVAIVLIVFVVWRAKK